MSEFHHVRTAVVGCGYWGANLLRAFASLSDLRVACDLSEAVRERVRRHYGAVRVTGSYQAVLDDPEVQGVVLATPAPLHAAMAIQALEAGKHVFVEKPLALSVADAERVARAADEAGRILMVGHLLEYHPAVEHIKAMIEQGELGEVYYAYSQRLNLGKLRSDENALWSLAPHDISMLLYLLDEEPEEVSASGQAFLQAGIEDVVFITLRFPSGRVAHVHVSWLDPHKERRLTVVGSRKMVVFNDMDPREKVRVFDKGLDRRAPGADPAALPEPVLFAPRDGDIVSPRIGGQEPLAIECAEFLRSIATGRPPRSDARDGLRVVRVLERAQAALAAGRPAYEVSPA
jgi:predicted dehydrogenase